MNSRFKVMGLALLAVLAIGAFGASAAWGHEFKSAGEPTDITGEQVGFINIFGSKSGVVEVSCKKATFTGTMDEEAEDQITLQPTYSECNTVMLGATPWDMNGCGYVLDSDTTSHMNTSGVLETHAPFSIECPAGQSIIVTAPACTITIGQTNNQNLHGVTYHNEGSGSTANLKSTLTLDNITYSSTGFLCNFIGLKPEGSDMLFTGAIALKAFTETGGHATSSHTALSLGGDMPPSFHSESSHSTLIGEASGAEKFELNAGTAECTEAGYKGTMSSKTPTEVTLAPEYAGCTAFGFGATEVKPNGCAYVLKAGEEEGSAIEGLVDIECPEGKTMEIVAKSRGLLKCTVTVGAQTNLKTVTYTNGGAGSSRDIKVDFNPSGVKYSQHTGEGLGKCENGSFSNGVISGSPTVIAENAEKKQVGFWTK